MKPIYLFDLDDTLIDSSRRFEDAILQVLDEDGVNYDAAWIKQQTLPLGLARTASAFCEWFNLPDTEEHILMRINEKLMRLYGEKFPFKAGARDYLNRLAEEDSRLFVLTATPKRFAVSALRRLGVLNLFEAVFCTEEDFGLYKDNIELFYEVASRLDTPPSRIRYFEDSLTAVETARSAGYQTYLIYNNQTHEQIAHLIQNHHRLIYSFEELI